MNSLKTKMNIYFSILIFVLVIVGFSGYQTVDQYQSYQKQIQLGKEAISFANEALKSKHSVSSFKKLQMFRESLSLPSRQELFSNVIQSYDEKNKFLNKKNLQLFEANEENYIKYIQEQTPYLVKKMVFFIGLAFFFTFSLLLGFYFQVRVRLLSAIEKLNNKMLDFVNQKYSYQFEIPPDNEIGNLQSTFNSLAQQTLSNIEKLKELDRAKSEFLSIASHELRTPLTSIKGSLGLLKQGITGPLNETAQKLVFIADEETERLIRLINDILDLTKMEANMLTLNKKWQPLEVLINKTMSSLQGLATTAEVTLKYNSEIPFLAFMDSDRIQQVLTNLISNAIKFSPKGSEIKITGERDDQGHLKISVADQGPGIAPEDQELIFQKFRQATSEQNPLVKGTGLGLAIVKALVEEHEGKLGVNSLPGKGSQFYFTLPEWKIDMSDSKIKIRNEVA